LGKTGCKRITLKKKSSQNNLFVFLHLSTKLKEMKKLIVCIGILMLMQSFQCEENTQTPAEDAQTELQALKLEIQNYINSIPCDAASGCNFLAFGSKPCGGPWEYLVFSNNVDLEWLTQKVTTYNELEHQFNLENNVISDCMMAMPPENLGCLNNQCTVLLNEEQ